MEVKEERVVAVKVLLGEQRHNREINLSYASLTILQIATTTTTRFICTVKATS